jgi:signal transduction histidine kinase
MRKYLLSSFLMLLLIPVSKWVIVPQLLRLPADFRYEAVLFSLDNFYNEQESRYLGEQVSLTRFNLRNVSGKNRVFQINNEFEVRKPSGDKIISVNKTYGIDPITGEHLKGAGDRERSGYLFAPKVNTKQDFLYWHVNYNTPALMKYQNEEHINGLLVYRYHSTFKADQTNDLKNLPGVPAERGIELDVSLDTWIEPRTASLIKYEDFATAWYYDKKTGVRLNPWNKFHNEYSNTSIEKQVQAAKTKLLKVQLFGFYGPLLFILIALLVFLAGYLRQTLLFILIRPFLALLLVLGIGMGSTLVLYFNLVKTGREKKSASFESNCTELYLAVKKELDAHKEVLEILRYDYYTMDGLSRDHFAKLSSHFSNLRGSIQALEWIPRVTPESKIEFIRKAREDFPGYCIVERGDLSAPETPAQNREHFPVYYIEPMEGNEIAMGFDFLSNPERKQAIEYSRTAREMTVTSPLATMDEKEKDQKVDKDKYFLMFNPVFSRMKESSQRSRDLAGFFVGVYKIDGIFNSALSTLDQPAWFGIHVSETGGVRKKELFSRVSSEDDGLTIRKNLPLLNKNWEFTFNADKSYIESSDNLSWAILLIGIGLTSLSCILVLRLFADNRQELKTINKELLFGKRQLEMRGQALENSNKELESFSYIATHDLRSPLINMKSLLELFDPSGLEGMNREVFEKLIKSTAQMDETLEDLVSILAQKKDVHHISETVFFDQQLRKVLEGIEEQLQESGAELLTDFSIKEIHYVPAHIRSILQNLISNAIKYRDASRKLVITVSTSKSQNKILLTVSDNGSGIDMNIHGERIFGLFKRFHDHIEGKGMGLYIVKTQVESLGGMLEVKSKPGEGSSFSVFLVDQQNLT